MSDDSDIYLRDDPEIEELPNTSIAYISQKMLARGITFEQLVALYVLPHSANTADITVYNRSVLKNLRKTIYDIAFEPEPAPESNENLLTEVDATNLSDDDDL